MTKQTNKIINARTRSDCDKSMQTPFHIGEIIQTEVKNQGLTQKEFGALIHKNEKTVPDIFKRHSIDTDLLVTISQALKVDLLKHYYDPEPMNSLRRDDNIRLTERNQHLARELSMKQELIDMKQELIDALRIQLSLVNKRLEENRRNHP